MLGYVIPTGRGEGDLFLQEVACALSRHGLSLAGVVQENVVLDAMARCEMDLQVLGPGDRVRISQFRGRHASGCRLDPQQLVDAAQRVANTLESDAIDLLIINKFGKSEAEGEGFRDVIARAIVKGVPVLTTVPASHLGAFLDFAADLAVPLPMALDVVTAWGLGQASGLARSQGAQ